MSNDYNDALEKINAITLKLDEIVKLLTLGLTINNEETLEGLRRELLEGNNSGNSQHVDD